MPKLAFLVCSLFRRAGLAAVLDQLEFDELSYSSCSEDIDVLLGEPSGFGVVGCECCFSLGVSVRSPSLCDELVDA